MKAERTTIRLFLLVIPLVAGPTWAESSHGSARQFELSRPAWQLIIPSSYPVRPGKIADLLIHFHGNPDTILENVCRADLDVAIVTVNYRGLSSAYGTPFSDKAVFQKLLEEARMRMRAEPDIPNGLEWDRICLSSFSAGYGAVREILTHAPYRERIAGLLLADYLYASTAGDGTPLDTQMVDFKAFAREAKAGRKTFLVSHSRVPTPTYESTMETADELLEHLEIAPRPISDKGWGSLDFYRHADQGGFQVWGAQGDDGESHLAHLRQIGYFLRELPLARQSE